MGLLLGCFAGRGPLVSVLQGGNGCESTAHERRSLAPQQRCRSPFLYGGAILLIYEKNTFGRG